MFNLLDGQVAILFFLLVSALLLVILCFVSYCIWKHWCSSPQSTTANSQGTTEEQNAVPTGTAEHQALIPNSGPASPSYQATWPRSSADRRIDDVPTTSAFQPSAPLLNQIDEPSHYSSTTALIPSESLPAATTAYHYDQANHSNNCYQGELPTYEETMRQQR